MKSTLKFLSISSLCVLIVGGLALFALPTLFGQPSFSLLGLNDSQGTDLTTESLLRETSFRTTTQNPAGKELVGVDQFLAMLRSGTAGVEAVLEQVEENWDISYVPMMLEAGRFLRPSQRALVMRKLETKTGQRFGADFDKWLQWNWKQKYEPHPDYSLFKAVLYSKIDPRFAEYFVQTEGATIRLDEVRWGGVRRDGIPPLKDPKMLAAKDADYLADTDVVFGIDLNGDARCYPKRILAWHEMFKDTIGGESVCGVY